MRVAVTGAGGFLGWHVRCRAFAAGDRTVPVGRDLLADPARLAAELSTVDLVVHCAGVNRGSAAEITDGNVGGAVALVEALRRVERAPRVVYANSVQANSVQANSVQANSVQADPVRADASGAYGESKRRAADVLAAAPGGLSDVVLPNLFGEHGRPRYNSFVATFCAEVAIGRTPAVVEDREIPLLHAQDAAAALLGEAAATGHRRVPVAGQPEAVSTVLRLLREFDEVYRTGELPDLRTRFRVRLFNTYRSHLFPARYPIAVTPRTDARGSLVECVRTGAAGGQAFVSTTVPGASRGDHVHLRKFERFLVVDGDAEIALRRLFTDEVVRFRVGGERPAVVDMPTMWAHRIAATGRRPATTFFWSNELLVEGDADTHACPVDRDPERAEVAA